MPKGIELGIASETKAFKQGVETGMIAPVEKAVEALDDLGKTRGPEQLEAALGDAQDASKRLERETKSTADAIDREFRASYKKVGTAADDGMRQAGSATQTFKDEAKANFAEVASSFDGTVSGVIDGVQGTLAGASVAIGGAAGAALGALALVGGVVGSTITTAIEEDAEAAEERIRTMYDNFIESGLTYLTQQQKIDAASALTGDPAKLAEFTQQAKDLGVSVQDIILAQISKGEERNDVQARLIEQIATYNAQLDDGVYKDGTRLTLFEGYLSQYKTLNGEQDKVTYAAEVQRSIAAEITGQQKLTSEEIQIQNRRLAERPATVTTKLIVDESDLEAKLSRGRNIRITADIYTRSGQKVD